MMSLSLSAVRPVMSTTTRLLLWGAAVTLGFIGGLTWGTEISAWAYEGFVAIFAEPGIQITSLGMGIGLAFLLGFVHVTSICYLPAAFAALPLVQTTRNSRDW